MSSTPTIPAVPYGQPPTGATPTGAAVTPPQGSFTQGDQPNIGTQPGAQDPDQIRKILQMLVSQQQRPQLPQPVPSPIAAPRQPQPTGSGLGWGFERFANSVGGHIQQAIAQKKQADLSKAESDWNQLAALMQSDPNKAQIWLAQNEKAAKNMAKALNQDWLNPEKTTVYKQALDNVMRQQQAKGKAASGLQSLVKHLIGRAQNPQLTDAQKQAIAQEQMAKAPTVTPPVDAKTLIELQKNIGDEFYRGQDLKLRQKEAQQKDQEFQQNYQLRLDELNDKMDMAKQAMTDRRASEQDRAQQWATMNQLRQESINVQKELAGYRMSTANTPKELQTEWTNVADDLNKRRVADYQAMNTFNKQGVFKSLLPGGPNREQLQDSITRDNAARALANRLQSAVIAGKLDPQEAKDKVYSVYDPSTKIAAMTDVQAYAKAKGVPVTKAQQEFESEGYVVY